MKNLKINNSLPLTVHRIVTDAAIVYLLDSKLNQYVLDWNTQGILMESLQEGMSLYCHVSAEGYVISVES